MNSTRKRVLVFEDLDRDWEPLRTALQLAGLDPVRANSAESFLAHTPFDSFSLILVDIFYGVWPGPRQEVGIDLTRAVKKVNPTIPIIVVSEQEPRRSLVAEAFRAGACDYVDKTEFIQNVSGTIDRIKATVTHNSGEDSAEQEFPLPIAFLLRDFLHSHNTGKRGVERMVELFEVVLKLTTYSLMAAHAPRLRSLLSSRLRADLARPSLGHFAQVLNALPQPAGFLAPLSHVTKNKRFRSLCENFIKLRNNYVGHGITQADAVYERLLTEHREQIADLLHMLKDFRKWQLVWPSKPDIEDEWFVYNEAKVFRGSNPEPTFHSIRTQSAIRPTDHVHLLKEDLTESVDLYPWCQYHDCEQMCLNRKLFLYRLAREGEIWALDHIYGHTLQTREGWLKVKELISDGQTP